MSQVPLAFPTERRSLGPGGWLERWSRKLVLERLRSLRHGRLSLVEGERRHAFGRKVGGSEPWSKSGMHVSSERWPWRGDRAAEAYMRGGGAATTCLDCAA